MCNITGAAFMDTKPMDASITNLNEFKAINQSQIPNLIFHIVLLT